MIEATNDAFRLPDKGILGNHAIFDPAMLDVPAIDEAFIDQQDEKEWRIEIKPDLIATLSQNKEEIVNLDFIPPEGVSVGDYDLKIRTECIADNQNVESEDKIVRVHIGAKTNVLGITILILLLIGLLVGIVVFGIKLTRR